MPTPRGVGARSPVQPFKFETAPLVAAQVFTVVQISANITGIGTVTAALAGTGALAAVVAGISIVTAAATGTGAIASTIAGTSVVTVAIAGTGALVSTIVGAAVVTATAVGAGALASTINGTSAITAAIIGAAFGSSTILGSTTVTGAATGSGALAAAIAGTSLVSATPSISINITSSATVTGAVTGKGAVASTIAGTAALISAITGQTSLAAIIVGASAVSAGIAGRTSLASVIAGTSIVSGAVAGTGLMASAIACTSAVTAAITSSGTGQIASVIFGNGFTAAAIFDGTALPQVVAPTNSTTFSSFGASVAECNVAGISYFASAHPVVSAGNDTQLGQLVMGGALLVAPSNGRLSGQTLYAVASGTVTIPASAAASTFNLVLNQNYFSNPHPVGNPSSIVVVSDLMAIGVPQALAPGTYPWLIVCQLCGNGRGNGILTSDYSVTINGVVSSGHFASNRNPYVEPVIQLSLAAQFTGTISGTDTFQALLTQFNLQR